MAELSRASDGPTIATLNEGLLAAQLEYQSGEVTDTQIGFYNLTELSFVDDPAAEAAATAILAAFDELGTAIDVLTDADEEFYVTDQMGQAVRAGKTVYTDMPYKISGQ